MIEVDGVLVAFKMESHNHPSYIEPYSGAATGVGGIIRDVLSMGARPIALLDFLCFGDIRNPRMKYLVEKVVEGIGDYGNCVGIPTVGGQTYFSKLFSGNILVNVVCVGIVEGKMFRGRAEKPEDVILYIGSKTGRDGIGGATMASEVFRGEEEEKKPAVQIGDPFAEKCLIEACLEAMNKFGDKIVAIQDMGAAGLLNSSTEMAAKGKLGAKVYIDKVPKRESGMKAWEVLVSESQERMLFIVKKEVAEGIMEIAKKWELSAEVIGETVESDSYIVFEDGKEVFNIPLSALIHKAPVYSRPEKELPKIKVSDVPEPEDPGEVFLKVLLSPNMASKEWIWSQYDHSVMTNTVLEPGYDAAIIRIKGRDTALALTTDCNPIYCFLNPYKGAMMAVLESARNIVCVGGRPLAATDCLNFGSPEDPKVMWQFARCIDGLRDALIKLKIPVVSGNVSFYNENEGVAIPPTPVVGMVGVVKTSEILKSKFSEAGLILALIGEDRGEIFGSEYLLTREILGGEPPTPRPDEEIRNAEVIRKIKGFLTSCHDVSEGGVILAAFESAEVGVRLKLNLEPRWDFAIFSESAPRYFISFRRGMFEYIKEVCRGMGAKLEIIGESTDEDIFSVDGLFSFKLSELKKEWSRRLEDEIV